MKKFLWGIVFLYVFSAISFCQGEIDLEKPIYIMNVVIEGIPEEIIIGDKIPFNIKEYPEINTEDGYSFYLRLGSDDQIHFEEGQYYLIPTKAGRNNLLVKTESGRSAEVEFWVRSPIDGVDIWNDDLFQVGNKHVLYVGQRVAIDYSFDMKSDYKKYDVLYDAIDWSVGNNLVATFEDATKNILTGRQQGMTQVTAKAKDGGYEDDLLIQVKSPVKSFIMTSGLTYSLYENSKIDLKMTLKDDLLYDLKLEDIDLPMAYVIEKQWIDARVIEKEILYEERILNGQLDSQSYISHSDRLSILKAILKREDHEGYCELPLTIGLKDRFNQPFRVARITKDEIIGYFPGKIRVRADLEGTSMYDVSVFYLNGVVEPDVIVNVGGYVILTGDDVLDISEPFIILNSAKELFYDKQEKNIPSRQTIVPIIQLVQRYSLPAVYFQDFERVLTENDLIDLREVMRSHKATYNQLVAWQLYIESVESVNLQDALKEMHKILE